MNQRILHVALVVRDYDEAIDFFTGILKFELLEDTYVPEQDKRWVLVAPRGSRGTSLLLARPSNAGQEEFIGNQTGGRVSFFLETDDFRRDFASLTQAGVEFVRPPAEARYGTVAVFKDLYGNLWDLIEPSRVGSDRHEPCVRDRAVPDLERSTPTLEGVHVRLEPLREAHLTPMAEVAFDPELWRWTMTRIVTFEDLTSYVQSALQEQRTGAALPFATVERSTGRVVGSTRFGNIDRANRRVEIGWTWIARPWQRTVLNTEAKYLMLRWAFEEAGCIRVELKTDARNERSRAAIARLGAVEEGVLRSHMITDTGRIRDTVYFSIIDSEWPAVRASLEEKLRRR
jgi:N-acetyltransferase